MREEIEEFLEEISADLEPITHCCECTPGFHFDRHMVHIQYPNCKCDTDKYILNKNEIII